MTKFANWYVLGETVEFSVTNFPDAGASLVGRIYDVDDFVSAFEANSQKGNLKILVNWGLDLFQIVGLNLKKHPMLLEPLGLNEQ